MVNLRSRNDGSGKGEAVKTNNNLPKCRKKSEFKQVNILRSFG